jgi:hypothetical protein
VHIAVYVVCWLVVFVVVGTGGHAAIRTTEAALAYVRRVAKCPPLLPRAGSATLGPSSRGEVCPIGPTAQSTRTGLDGRGLEASYFPPKPQVLVEHISGHPMVTPLISAAQRQARNTCQGEGRGFDPRLPLH